MPVGFLLIGAGVLVISYSANMHSPDEWLMWGISSAIIFNFGLGILGNAYVHKVKSDLIRKERSRQQLSDEGEL